MQVDELRRAYATLGLVEHATPTQIRNAYLTWVDLLEGGVASKSTYAEQASTDLSRHALDLAWHAIEQAHTRGPRVPGQTQRSPERTAGSGRAARPGRPSGNRRAGRRGPATRARRGLTRSGVIWLAIVTTFLLAIGLAIPAERVGADPAPGDQTRSTAPA
jgi:hypothetical protein